MSSEENENHLIISNTGGMIRKMDHQLELMNRVLGEIAERKTELVTGDLFIGMRAGEERDWEIAPGVKMTFCWCPPGKFLMGGPEKEEYRHNNERQIDVTLTKGFWMAKTQVTQKQWVTIMKNNPSEFKGENLPAEKVSWDDAQEFLEKLNEKIGNTDGGKMVLPTEAQWEYACRAGEVGPYSGGTIDEVAWYRENSGNRTHPVGMKDPNAWGLNDMHGNVWEWCNDWYDFYLSGGVDPHGPLSGTFRVIRGGSWHDYATYCRASVRFIDFPSGAIHGGGFRVVRIVSPIKPVTG